MRKATPVQIAGLICIVAAVGLMFLGRDGWGWLLVIALLSWCQD